MMEFSDIPVLETERLILRANRLEDFESYAEFYATDRAAHRGGVKNRTQAFLMFMAEIGHWHLRGYGFWALEEKSTGRYLGRAGLWCPDGWPEREIGWTLMDHAEGRGFAGFTLSHNVASPEAVDATLELVHEGNVEQSIAVVDPTILDDIIIFQFWSPNATDCPIIVRPCLGDHFSLIDTPGLSARIGQNPYTPVDQIRIRIDNGYAQFVEP